LQPEGPRCDQTGGGMNNPMRFQDPGDYLLTFLFI